MRSSIARRARSPRRRARLRRADRAAAGRGLGVSSDVIFLLAEIDGAPSCVVLPAEGRGGDGWEVGELDKVGYRGVESADLPLPPRSQAPDAEVLGDAPGDGARQMLDALDVGRVNVACRGLGILRPLPRLRGRGVDHARRSATGCSGSTRTRSCASASWSCARPRSRRSWSARPPRSTRAPATPASSRPPRRSSPPTARSGPSTSPPGWPPRAPTRPGDELARLRRDAPQTQIGEGANDALLMALARPLLR